jgi:hypothetical protein
MMLRYVLTFATVLFANQTFAQIDRSPKGEAQWLLERMTGVKWSATDPVVQQMTQLISAGDKAGAANLAMSQPQFLNVVVKQMALKMSTREETIRAPFNDFAAMMMGVTRDSLDARYLLYGNFFYVGGDPAKAPGAPETLVTDFSLANVSINGQNIRSNLLRDVIGSNNHYEDLNRSNIDIGASLSRVDGQRMAGSATVSVTVDIIGTAGNVIGQEVRTSVVTQPIPHVDPAGLLTTRAFMGAHAIAGTNRRLVEYTFRQFMCMGIEEWADTAGSDLRIGRDVDRLPGGDQNKFLSNCKGCHSVMDGFRGAFAKFDWRDGINEIGSAVLHVDNGATGGDLRPNVVNNSATTSGVVRKLNRPEFVQYAGGYVSTDDSFVNNANRGVNALLFGWRSPAPEPAGPVPARLASRTAGAHAFGRLVAGSRRFGYCMAKRVWDEVCHVEYSDAEMQAIYASVGLAFETEGQNSESRNGFVMKKLFEKVALHPKCRR